MTFEVKIQIDEFWVSVDATDEEEAETKALDAFAYHMAEHVKNDHWVDTTIETFKRNTTIK